MQFRSIGQKALAFLLAGILSTMLFSINAIANQISSIPNTWNDILDAKERRYEIYHAYSDVVYAAWSQVFNDYPELSEDVLAEMVQYSLYDLDNDGLVELFVNTTTSEAEAFIDVYTFGDELIHLGQLSGFYSSIWNDGKRTVRWEQVGSHRAIYSITKKNNTIVEKKEYEDLNEETVPEDYINYACSSYSGADTYGLDSTVGTFLNYEELEYNNHIYRIYSSVLSPENAEIFCQSNNGHLVSIASSKESDAISSYINGKDSLTTVGWFTGLHFTGNYGGLQYEWIDGTDYNYSNWEEGHDGFLETHASERDDIYGALLPSGKWHSSLWSWGDFQSFICEWDSKEDYQSFQHGKSTQDEAIDNPSASDDVSLYITPTSLSLNVDETKQITAMYAPPLEEGKSIKWTSSDESVVTVANDGTVNGVGSGTATITATYPDTSISAKCEIIVDAEESPRGNELIFSTDVWGFSNYGHENCNDFLTWSDQAVLFHNQSASQIEKFKEGLNGIGDGGHCYGLSATVILEKMGAESIRRDFSIPSLRAASLNTSNNGRTIQSLLCFYQLLQFQNEVLDEKDRYSLLTTAERLRDLAKKADAVKNGSCPVLLCFGMDGYYSRFFGGSHAVVAYGLEKGAFKSSKSGKTYNNRVLLYDCNVVDWKEDNCLLFNEGTGDWEIPAYYSQGGASDKNGTLESALADVSLIGAVGETRGEMYDEFKAHLRAKNADRLTVKRSGTKDEWLIDSKKWSVEGTDGLRLYHDTSSNGVDDKTPPINAILPDNASTYEVMADSKESNGFEVSTYYGDKYYRVKAKSADSAVFDPNGLVRIIGTKGDFDLTIAVDDSTKQFESYSIQGTAIGDVVVSVKDNCVTIDSPDLEDISVQARDYSQGVTTNVVQKSEVESSEISIYRDNEKLVLKEDIPAPSIISPNEKLLNGIVKGADGKWAMYIDGKVDTSYNGIAQNQYGWWRVKDGYVDFSANGIYKNEHGWWKTTNGKVTFKETGVFKNENGWWRVENSKVNFKANGIYKNKHGWWKTTNGKVTFKETGIFKNEHGWWRVKDSKVDFKANGIYQNQNGWWKTTNGKVTFKENGVFKNEYGWWKVKDSKVDFSFTGIASNKYGKWYIKDGKVDFSKNGKLNYNGSTYSIKNGKVQ